MEKTLKGKRVIVTGASRGIGAVIARDLFFSGCQVLITGRDSDRLGQAKAEILEEADQLEPEHTGTLHLFTGDMGEPKVPQAIVREAEKILGGIDILVNNAGIASTADFEHTTEKEWNRLIAVNARGPFLLCQAALPYLKKSSAPFIINIASVVAQKGYARQAAYTASKHALLGFTKSMAKELAPLGIRVHIISPGGVDTAMVQEMRPDINSADLIRAGEISEAVLFLLTRRGNGVIDEINIHRAGKDPWI